MWQEQPSSCYGVHIKLYTPSFIKINGAQNNELLLHKSWTTKVANSSKYV